ncbi:hypothetical protein M9Y10_042091 [Tritrichomonas musculus]|uniref:USP domain-containing protein n=1 Tax=Tritrichomonas musculus TaxID=1915356 RepID=A0ABR2K764_9EUKA
MKLLQSCLISDTQANKSFHSLKAKFAPKNIAWGTSWKLRMCLAVLQWNLGENLRAFLDEKFDLNLSPQCSEFLSRIESSLKRKRYVSKSLEAHKRRNYHRKIKRKGNKDDPEGHLNKNDKQKKKKNNAKGQKNDKSKKNNKEEQNHQYLMQSRICPGITNAGSTCFFATIIQILANTQVPSILSAEAMTRIPICFFNIINIVFQQLLSDHDLFKNKCRAYICIFPKI